MIIRESKIVSLDFNILDIVRESLVMLVGMIQLFSMEDIVRKGFVQKVIQCF